MIFNISKEGKKNTRIEPMLWQVSIKVNSKSKMHGSGSIIGYWVLFCLHLKTNKLLVA